MILSLLTLDLTAPGVRQSLRDAQDLHRSIMKAFDNSRLADQVLYRLIRSSNSIQIYVQSKGIPSWERIEHSGFHCVKSRDISLLLDSFQEGQVLHFKLLGCPSKKVSGDGKNSKRVLLRNEEEQLDWMKYQGEKNGFRILEIHIAGKAEKTFGSKESGIFYLSGIPFEGVLQINDSELFRKAFKNGIGAEKAYGFGLLMVSKV